MHALRTLLTVTISMAAIIGPSQPLLASPSSRTESDLPTVDEVIASAIKAVGGKEAVNSIQTLRAVFEMEFGGQKIINDTSWSRDGGRLARMTVPGMGEVLQGTDGKIAWRRSPVGYQILNGNEARQFEGQANFYRMVLEPDAMAQENSATIVVQGREPFAEAECYRLHYVSKDGQEGDVFFNAESGLFAGSRQTSDTPRGKQTTVMTLADWQSTAGVMFFRTVNVQTGGGTTMAPMALKATTIEVNSLSADAFSLPEEVKKLAEAQKPTEPQAGEIALSDLAPEVQAQATQMIDGIKQAGTAPVVKSTISSLEQASKYAQEPQKKMFDYVLQELRKYQKALEGGG